MANAGLRARVVMAGERFARSGHVTAAGLAIALAVSAGAWAQPSALPRTLAQLDRGRDATILVAGDSLVAGVRPSTGGAIDPDGENGATSWVGHFAQLLAERYPAARVVLIRRPPEIDADGNATCGVAQAVPRVLQSPAMPKQTITVIRDGVGGNNVYRLLARWDDDVHTQFPAGDRPPQAWKPTAVIVALGVNDSLRGGSALGCYPDRHRLAGIGTVDLRKRGEPVAGFSKGLLALGRRLGRIDPAPEIAFATAPGTFGAAATGTYAQAMREGAQRARAGLIDLERAMRERQPASREESRGSSAECAGHPWYRGTDCLHPNAAGSEAIGAAAFAAAFGPRPYSAGRR